MSSDQQNDNNEILAGFVKNPSNIQPRKLTADSRIRFRFNPGVSCFISCCGHLNIILPPYYILLIRNALHLPAEECLRRLTSPSAQVNAHPPHVAT